MSVSFYKFVHLLGIFMTLIALGGVAFHALSGGNKENFISRKKAGALHGIGLVLVLIAGFGLMARMQLRFSENLWLWGKLIVWLTLGAYPVFFYKKSAKAKGLLAGLFAVLFVTLYLVVFKPF